MKKGFVIICSLSKNKKHLVLEFELSQGDWKLVINTIKSFGFASFNKEDVCWLIPNDSRYFKTTIESLTSIGCTLVFDKDVQTAIENAQNKEEKREKKNEKINELKFQLTVDINIDFSSFLKLNPFPYQKVGFKFFQITDGNCVLGDDPGLGKSMQSISYTEYHRFRTLIICPASLKFVWENEINKFALNERSILIPKNGDVIGLREQYDYMIVNYESLISRKGSTSKHKSLSDIIAERARKGKFDCVIIDEAHRMKNQSAKATKFIHKNLRTVKHRLLLTGTPIKSRPIEYFSLLKFLDKKRWNNKTEFGMRYCNPTKTRWGYDFSGASNLEELYKETAPYIIRRLKSEVLKELPEKIYTSIPIHLDNAQETAYSKLEDNVIDTLDDIGTDTQTDLELLQGQQSNAINNKQRFAAISNIHKLKLFTSRIKVESTNEIVENIISSGKKIIIFTYYTEIIEMLKKMYAGRCVTFTGATPQNARKQVVTDFQTNEKISVFIGQTIAAGVGLTLTAADTVLFIDEMWTPGDMIQAEDRAHRVGQLNSVQILTPLCTNSMDEKINELLREKRKILSKVLDNKEDSRVDNMNILNDIIKLYKQKKRKKKL